MEIKAGDTVDFVAISWTEPQWDFDYPTVLLEPIIRYDPNGGGCWGIIENTAIDYCGFDGMEDEDVSQEFNCRGWKLDRLKKVAKDRISGKDTWKTKIKEVFIQKLYFYEDDIGLAFKIIEENTY